MISQVKNKTEFNQALQSWQEQSTATTNNELTLYNGNIYKLTIHPQILSYEIVGKYGVLMMLLYKETLKINYYINLPMIC